MADTETKPKTSFLWFQKYHEARDRGVSAPAGEIAREDWPKTFQVEYSSTSLHIAKNEVVSDADTVKLIKKLLSLGLSGTQLLQLLKRGINVDDRAEAVKPIEVACGVIEISNTEAYKIGTRKLSIMGKKNPQEFNRINAINIAGDTDGFDAEIIKLGATVEATIKLSDLEKAIVKTVKLDNARA